MCINETWLDDSFKDTDINLPGYDVIRKDRNRNGGGVCIFIKRCFKYTVLHDINCGTESIWLSLNFKKDEYIIGTLYRPPSADNCYYENMLNEIENARSKCENVLLLGDLNFDYRFDESLSSNPIMYIESLYELTQLVDKPTRITNTCSSLLDVVLTSVPNNHIKTNVIQISLSDHYCIETIVKCRGSKPVQNHNEIEFRNYKDFDNEAFMNDLLCHSIMTADCNKDNIKVLWEEFKNVFIELSNKHAPITVRRLKDRRNPWITNEIVNKMYERDYVKKQADITKSVNLQDQYKKLRNEVTLLINKTKKEYYEKERIACTKNPKKMWKIFNKLISNDIQYNVPSEISADDFNNFFSTIGQETASTLPGINEPIPWKGLCTNQRFKFVNIQVQDVITILGKLGSDSNVDVLGFDAKLLCISASIISPLLTRMINVSVFSNIVIDDWKTAKVTPVYKGKGDKFEKGNYRPISVISHIAKILEREVHKQLLKYLVDIMNFFVLISLHIESFIILRQLYIG
jgi:hypothetical protein